MALKSSSDLFWMAEYFVFQEGVSVGFGFPAHADADWVWITNFGPLPSAILVAVEVGIVFLDFSNLGSFGLQKTISRFMST